MSEARTPLQHRAQQIATIRSFFAERAVTEVHTPVITDKGITEVHIQSLQLDDGRFLRSSPEFVHKQLLARGSGDIFELGPVFRAGEHGRLHREEFLMLEWYRVGWQWQQLADEVLALIATLVEDGQRPIERIRWQDLAQRTLGFDPLTDNVNATRALSEAPENLDPGEQLDWLFSLRMQPKISSHSITVVHDFPASQAALAKVNDDPLTAARFEVFVDSVELANGYQELTDPIEQRRRFEQDNQRRQRLGLPSMPVDEDLLGALERGLPDCAGVALGVDRLLMIADNRSELGYIRS